MSFYEDRVLPHVINLSMRNRDLLAYRQRALSLATGRVLEIGVGSGLNLRFYPTRVREIVGLEPASRLVAMARRAAAGLPIETNFIEASAESIPLEGGSVDTIVTTWTLCTIPDVATALREMHRVLKPNGQLLFVEHGRAPEERVRKWQDRLTPVWKCIGGGCHLNRPIRDLIERGGFAVTHLDTGYMRGPKPMTFMYEGRARPAQTSASKESKDLLRLHKYANLTPHVPLAVLAQDQIDSAVGAIDGVLMASLGVNKESKDLLRLRKICKPDTEVGAIMLRWRNPLQ